MTKCIVLGEKESPKKVLKSIKFINLITEDGKLRKAEMTPSEYNNIELICKEYCHGECDLMFAYYYDRNDGNLYLGHWNDGVI